MTATSIQQLAAEAFAHMEKRPHDRGRDTWHVKDGAPEWMVDLCRAAHSAGDMLPDDWRYEFIADALIALENADDPDEPELEPSVYTGELTGWLASNVNRYGYCDEATEDYGPFKSLIGLLQAGQLREMEEVYRQVVDFLRDRLDEQDEDEGDE